MTLQNPLVTYRQADGEPVYGEYSWVTDLEFFDDLDEPITLIKETWTLTSTEELVVKPYHWDDEEEADA